MHALTGDGKPRYIAKSCLEGASGTLVIGERHPSVNVIRCEAGTPGWGANKLGREVRFGCRIRERMSGTEDGWSCRKQPGFLRSKLFLSVEKFIIDGGVLLIKIWLEVGTYFCNLLNYPNSYGEQR
jgi:hypothetical protein